MSADQLVMGSGACQLQGAVDPTSHTLVQLEDVLPEVSEDKRSGLAVHAFPEELGVVGVGLEGIEVVIVCGKVDYIFCVDSIEVDTLHHLKIRNHSIINTKVMMTAIIIITPSIYI